MSDKSDNVGVLPFPCPICDGKHSLVAVSEDKIFCISCSNKVDDNGEKVFGVNYDVDYIEGELLQKHIERP